MNWSLKDQKILSLSATFLTLHHFDAQVSWCSPIYSPTDTTGRAANPNTGQVSAQAGLFAHTGICHSFQNSKLSEAT